MSKTYADQHDDLVDLARTIVGVVRQAEPGWLNALARGRLALAKAVNEHVLAETALIRQVRPDTRRHQALLTRYHDELLAWRRDLIENNARWHMKAIADDPDGFVQDYRPLLTALEARVAWEEAEFYPQVLHVADLTRLAA